jgi:hypothetical protein
MKDLKLSDRELLRMILAAQRDMAAALIGGVGQHSSDKLQQLWWNLNEVLKGIPKQGES